VDGPARFVLVFFPERREENRLVALEAARVRVYTPPNKVSGGEASGAKRGEPSMRNASLCSLAVFALFLTGQARADDSQNKAHQKATIDKVDSAKGTISVMMKGPDGKETEKTFPMDSGAAYFNGHGKTIKLDAFHHGDHVLIAEKDGKVTELRKEPSAATITHIDAKKGTIEVKMRDHDGKDVDKTFHLTEDAEYFDSTGNVAVMDVFRSGDQVLIVESEGKIKEMKKDDKSHSGVAGKKNGQK
jgi:hypothetical protein